MLPVMPKKPPTPDLAALLPSWELDLKAARKSPNTLDAYLSGARIFIAWCADNDRPAVLDKGTVNAWVADLLEGGAADTTAVSRQLSVKRLSAWLTEEGEFKTDPLLGLKPPKVDEHVVDPLTTDQIRAMLATCNGKDFRSRRDEAIIRFLSETGARAGELLGMDLPDVNLAGGVATIRRGKGGKGRIVPFGPQTARALDRYIRLRRTHKLAGTPTLWLGDRSRDFSYSGLRKTLQRRAEDAGIGDFHVHRLRHTFADRWLSADGSEGGLMSVAGWSDGRMLRRYTKARASQRAADEARRLNLGDL